VVITERKKRNINPPRSVHEIMIAAAAAAAAAVIRTM